ncbi:hypothetical protein HA402_012742 [Bradysia odoriphaga]|nr:hypothetical protein HA402_012742 [Bradysia odoriphaga]
MLRALRNFNNFNKILSTRSLASGSAFGDFQFKGREKSALKSSYDVVIVGAGHNGLIAAGYLQKSGLSVAVVESRHVVGGAAVTEEIIPGFKFSRASYVLSLLRPYIINDLKLKEYGLKYYFREPYNSYTPIRDDFWSLPEYPAKSLLLSNKLELSQAEIAKFSVKDAQAYKSYEAEMGRYCKAVTHLIDSRPPHMKKNSKLGLRERLNQFLPTLRALKELGPSRIPDFHDLLTSPASRILDHWFSSQPLKATLATDAVIGTMQGPQCPGTGYVLLHHVFGGIDGREGAWVYVEGGMGSLSAAIANSAAALGADIFTSSEVQEIVVKNGKACAVALKSGEQIEAKNAILSGTTPHVTFKKLLTEKTVNDSLGVEFLNKIQGIDYTSPVTKINVAVNKLPNFIANPSSSPGKVEPWHIGTIHLNCENMDLLSDSYTSCITSNCPSTKPMIEMVIPSTLDPTLCKDGTHVCLLFTQFTPINPSNGSWESPEYKESYAKTVFEIIESYAPGFIDSIVGKEVLSPWDLEKEFGLTGGNIFHGAMGMDQLFWLRPIRSENCWFPETPIENLYLCGSGSHPGGGVMGASGFIAAQTVLANK